MSETKSFNSTDGFPTITLLRALLNASPGRGPYALIMAVLRVLYDMSLAASSSNVTKCLNSLVTSSGRFLINACRFVNCFSMEKICNINPFHFPRPIFGRDQNFWSRPIFCLNFGRDQFFSPDFGRDQNFIFHFGHDQNFIFDFGRDQIFIFVFGGDQNVIFNFGRYQNFIFDFGGNQNALLPWLKQFNLPS